MTHNNDNDTAAVLEEIRNLTAALSEQGSFLECIELHEKALRVKTHIFGPSSRQVMTEQLDIADCYNKLVRRTLHRDAVEGDTGKSTRKQSPAISPDEAETVKKYMKMAEILTEPEANMPEMRRLEVRSAVFNNLMYLAKKEGNLRLAREYAQKGLQLHRKHHMLEAEAESLLCIAALHSAMGRHKQALECAEGALDVVLALEERRFAQDSTLLHGRNRPNARDKIYFAPLQVFCYINIGTELEHLERHSECLEAYETAYQLSYMAMGASHPLTLRSRKSFAEVFRLVTVKNATAVNRAAKKVVVTPADTLHHLTLLHNAELNRRVAQRMSPERPHTRPSSRVEAYQRDIHDVYC
eukprot:EG_transcript_13800